MGISKFPAGYRPFTCYIIHKSTQKIYQTYKLYPDLTTNLGWLTLYTCMICLMIWLLNKLLRHTIYIHNGHWWAFNRVLTFHLPYHTQIHPGDIPDLQTLHRPCVLESVHMWHVYWFDCLTSFSDVLNRSTMDIDVVPTGCWPFTCHIIHKSIQKIYTRLTNSTQIWLPTLGD